MNLHGFFFDAPLFALAVFLVGALALGFLAAPFFAWALFGGFVLLGLGAPTWLFVAWGVVAAIGLLKPLRKALVSGPLMRMMKALKFLPNSPCIIYTDRCPVTIDCRTTFNREF